jgi:hypothetical protein
MSLVMTRFPETIRGKVTRSNGASSSLAAATMYQQRKILFILDESYYDVHLLNRGWIKIRDGKIGILDSLSCEPVTRQRRFLGQRQDMSDANMR